VEHEPQVFEINISNSCSTIEAFSGILSGFYTPGIAGRRLRLDNLNTTDFTTSQMAGVRPPVSGTTLPLLNQPEGRGPPIRRGSYEGVNRAVWDSAPPKNQTAHRGTQLGISGPYGIGSTGYDDKPHIPPHWKVPGFRTPQPFTSEPEALSHYLRVGITRDSGTRTFSTMEGPTASSTDVPSDKDELSLVLPHVGQLG
jgi:hypothetical protein